MRSKKLRYTLAALLLIGAACPIVAKQTPKTPPAEAKPAPEPSPSAAPAVSVKKGDPPPGNAMKLSVVQARAVLREAITKRYTGKISACGGALGLKACMEHTLSTAVDLRVRSADFSFFAPGSYRWTGFVPGNMKRSQAEGGKVAINFSQADYLQVLTLNETEPKTNFYPKTLYIVGFVPNPVRATIASMSLSWLTEAAAQSFCDAFNRLVYAAYHQEDFAAFSAAAKAWRENPDKPPLSPEAERLKAVAEKALADQNLDAAVEGYEKVLEIQPMWPEGWYVLGLLYAQQNYYPGAANCMRHYLELAPDAPDAQEAREKMAAWQAQPKQ